MFSRGLGCNMAHQTVSRWISLPWTQPAIMVYFCNKKTHFCRSPAMDLWLNGPEMASNHVPTWVRNVQVEKAPKVSITVSLTQKSLQKHVKNGLK